MKPSSFYTQEEVLIMSELTPDADLVTRPVRHWDMRAWKNGCLSYLKESEPAKDTHLVHARRKPSARVSKGRIWNPRGSENFHLATGW